MKRTQLGVETLSYITSVLLCHGSHNLCFSMDREGGMSGLRCFKKKKAQTNKLE